MPLFLPHRRRTAELMDRPDADPAALRRSLAYIRRVNAWLGYTRAAVAHFERFSRRWQPGRRVRVLDVATGSADIPRALLAWAAQRGFDLEVVAVDLHPRTVEAAGAAGTPDPRLTLLRADALHLPFADGSFDYAHTAMFLHHLDDADAVRVLREMHRVAARGLVASDLLRHARAYAWITLLTLTASPMVKHDARASVAQAFTRGEVLALRERAGVEYTQYYRHFGHRFSIAGERA